MRYYTYVEPRDPEKGDWSTEYITVSEETILKEYWDYWYGRMCEVHGKEHVDANYGPEECIEDWCTVHWAIESD